MDSSLGIRFWLKEEKQLNDQTYIFIMDERLGIALPALEKDWEQFTTREQEFILAEWEIIRGRIPDRVKELENEINMKQEQLNREENFARSCELNSQISELASTINDLHLWYRAQQDMDHKPHLG
jgi:hypothetical protein